MYKYQLQKWGARKNLTVSFLHELDAGAAPENGEGGAEQRRMLFRGREINKAELQSYVIRRAHRNKWNRALFKDETVRRSSEDDSVLDESDEFLLDSERLVTYKSGPPSSLLGPLRMPDDFYNFEKVFFSFKSYAEYAFSDWAWLNGSAVDLSPYTKLDLWTVQMTTVRDLLRDGQIRQAFRMLDFCYQQCFDLIKTQEPRLVVLFFRAILPFLSQHRELVRDFLKWVGGLSTVLHGPLHPLRQVAEICYRMDQVDIIRRATPLLRSYQTFLQREIPKSRSHNFIRDCALRETKMTSTTHYEPAEGSTDLAAVSWLGGYHFHTADTLAAQSTWQTYLPILPASAEEDDDDEEDDEEVEWSEELDRGKGLDEHAKYNDDDHATSEQGSDLPPLGRLFNAGRRWFDTILCLMTVPKPRRGYSRLQYSCVS